MLKYNWSVLKNKEIGFIILESGKPNKISNLLLDVKENNQNYIFCFKNSKLEVLKTYFNSLLIKEENEVIWFVPGNPCNNYASAMIAFSMFDTYGFPVEITEEIFNEKNLKIDVKGYDVLKKIQKEKSQGTYKKTDAF